MKVQAKDVRVGNLVYWSHFKGDETLYEVMAADIVHMEKEPAEHQHYSGIPLTEEWLLKFGFDDIEDGWYTKGNEQFSWNIYDKCLRFRGMWIAEPDYVHQLQNLFFALTGEELTIK